MWVQWVLMYLTDEDCLQFFKKAHKHLVKNTNGEKKTGLIFVKENVRRKKKVDEKDYSTSRPII